MADNRQIFRIEGIIACEEFCEEYFRIVDPLVDHEKIHERVSSYLNQLVELDIQILLNTEHFEKLTDCPDVYSMKIKRKGCNLRILFSYARNGSILLHSFIEESGKRKTDYSSHTPIARRRLKEQKGGSRYEKRSR